MKDNHPREDDRSKRVLGFLIAKDLLRHEFYPGKPNATFSIEEVIWVAENVEPRVLEVLPAAFIHHRSAFTSEELPSIFKETVEGILAGRDDGISIGDFSYKNMKRWSDLEAQKLK